MAQTKFKVEDGLLVRGQANITGNILISGTTSLEGNVITNVIVGGNVSPTSNNSHNLGSTGSRWLRIFANSGTFANTLEVTGQANLYGGAHLQGNVSFNNNNHVVGSNTAMPNMVHASNTIVYNTLQVGAPGSIRLMVNTSVTQVSTNLSVTADRISIGNGSVITLANSANITSNTTLAAPAVVHEILSNTNIKVAKYFIHAQNNLNNEVQSSELILLYNGSNQTVNISEYGVVFSGSAPFVNYSAFVGTGGVATRLGAWSPSSNNITLKMHIVGIF